MCFGFGRLGGRDVATTVTGLPPMLDREIIYGHWWEEIRREKGAACRDWEGDR